MSQIKCTLPKKFDDVVIKNSPFLGPSIESKFDELKYEVVHKIEKELNDSQNAREYISQKYDELCNKIQFLTELEATVTGFRTDVKSIEKQIAQLATRVDDIEKMAISKESFRLEPRSSRSSSMNINMTSPTTTATSDKPTTPVMQRWVGAGFK